MSNFATGNLRDMYRMFYNTKKLESLDLSKFSTVSADNLTEIFTNINEGRNVTIILDIDKCKEMKDHLPENAQIVKPITP